MDKTGAGAGFFRFLLPIYIPYAPPQSSSLSSEAGTIGQEWPQCQQPHKPNNNNNKNTSFYSSNSGIRASNPNLCKHVCRSPFFCFPVVIEVFKWPATHYPRSSTKYSLIKFHIVGNGKSWTLSLLCHKAGEHSKPAYLQLVTKKQ
jgi:hypothetical protein